MQKGDPSPSFGMVAFKEMWQIACEADKGINKDSKLWGNKSKMVASPWLASMEPVRVFLCFTPIQPLAERLSISEISEDWWEEGGTKD